MPAMRVFAVTFVALVGVLAFLATARSRRPKPVPALTLAGLIGVAGCVAVTGYFLSRYPMGARHFPPAYAVFLAAMLAGCLWLTLSPPRALASDPVTIGLGLAVAMCLGAGLVVSSRLGLHRIAGMQAGIFPYVFFVPAGALFAGSALSVVRRRSFGAGVRFAVWAAVFASLATFAVAISESVLWFDALTSLILAGDGIPAEAVGENIRNFTWGLILLPFWWLPFGVIGAAAGRSRRLRKRSRIPA